LFVDALVLSVVNFVESDEEFIVLAQKLEKISEFFAFGDVVVTVLIFGLRNSLSCHIRSHQHWLGCEQNGQLDDIRDALVDFCQR
jgi:hypothetical protein